MGSICYATEAQPADRVSLDRILYEPSSSNPSWPTIQRGKQPVRLSEGRSAQREGTGASIWRMTSRSSSRSQR